MVQEIEISRLNEAAYNPRIALTPGMPQYESLKASIEEFGDVKPIVWNRRTGNVVGGHQRLAVLKELGYETALCSVVDMDLAEEKLLNVALNKIKGRWDYDKLEDLIRELNRELLTNTSGFTAAELALLASNNDDLFGDESEWNGDWDFGVDENEPDNAESYVVTLVFSSWYFAQAWAEAEGYEGYVKEGKESTVIRVGEE